MTKRGRPTTYDPALAEKICERLAAGDSLRSLCAKDDMPARAAVNRWLNDYPEFRDRYARACEERADNIFEAMEELAQDALKSETMVEVQAHKLLIDTRKWQLAKMQPKKYGDRTILAGDAENPLTVVDDTARAAKLASLLALAKQRKAEDDARDLV